MNNTQLYLAIGLPVFANLCTMAAVITATLLSRAQVNRMCANIDQMCDRSYPERAAIWNNFIERMAKLESRN